MLNIISHNDNYYFILNVKYYCIDIYIFPRICKCYLETFHNFLQPLLTFTYSQEYVNVSKTV